VKIVWSPLAIERAYEAASYFAADKPQAALRWLDSDRVPILTVRSFAQRFDDDDVL